MSGLPGLPPLELLDEELEDEDDEDELELDEEELLVAPDDVDVLIPPVELLVEEMTTDPPPLPPPPEPNPQSTREVLPPAAVLSPVPPCILPHPLFSSPPYNYRCRRRIVNNLEIWAVEYPEATHLCM